ncbi:uncharacterized protein RAG0_13610 [Rhynchosporium agropyri]|uniref:J domain-containing protein n=1 Tax=Rhynchosporium agropyri TaxID=914238 RepID=A0A1E1LDV0_9HELO|nr:uncharacterized protein RAG0_13610 [Rhynchosporium agropyri]
MASSIQNDMAPLIRSRNPSVEDEPLSEDTNMPDPAEGPPPPGDLQQTQDSYREIKRIMGSSDYYTILDLEKDYSPDQLKKQYRKLAKLTHPDKTAWPDAELAFKKLSTAYAVLEDSSERRSYDKAPERYTPPDPPERPFGEEFADNAFGGSDSGNESDNNIEDEEMTTLRPSEAIKAIYKDATPLIQGILGDPPSAREKPRMMEEVAKFNKKIKAQNKTDGLAEKDLGHFFIQYTIFESQALLAKPFWEKLKNDPSDSIALGKMEAIEKVLKNTITKHEYNSGWCYKALGFKPMGGNSPGQPKQDSDKGGEFTGTGEPWSSQDDAVVTFTPGHTLTGEKIIAMLPRERTVRRMGEDGIRGPPEKIITGYQFIVKDEKDNLIELVSGEDIGRKATSGYLSLPRDQIFDARYSEKHVKQDDTDSFKSLIDFTAKPFNLRSSNTPRHPPGYGLVLFKDETESVLSRTALRKMLGPTDADFEIQQCEKRNGKIPAWMIEPLGRREPRKMVIESPTAKRRSREALMRGDQLDEQGLFVPKDRTMKLPMKLPKERRGRTHSRSSVYSANKGGRSDSKRSVTAEEVAGMQDEISGIRKDMQDLKEMLRQMVLKK